MSQQIDPLCEARALEAAGDLERAAEQYERALAAGGATLDVLLDLSILYWQATDPGSAARLRLGPEFLERAALRCGQLLDDAVALFPRSTEARFWRRYVDWLDRGGSLSVEECEQLVREDPDVLTPAMQVFVGSASTRMEAQAAELLRLCREHQTSRGRYVRSVLESAFRSRGARDRR